MDIAYNHHFANSPPFDVSLLIILKKLLEATRVALNAARVAESTLLPVYIYICAVDGKTDNPSKDIFSEAQRRHIAQGRARLNWCLSKS